MKNIIIDLFTETHELPLTAFKSRIQEIKGDYDFFFPAKGIEDTNILLISGVNKEFISVFNALIGDNILTFEPCSFLVVNFDGGEIYDLPLAKAKKLDYKTPHWLPLLIKRGKNFVVSKNINR